MLGVSDLDTVMDLDSNDDAATLFASINRDKVHGLNLAVPESAKELIKPWNQRDDTEKFADSGVDDQMVIHVPFVENVRLKSVALKIGRGDFAPRRLRIYANHPSIVDFADADSTRPQLDLALLQETVGTDIVEYPLRASTFASVNSVSLFFSESPGEEVSRVYFIGFKGDIRSPRKEGTNKLEIPAANAADAPLIDRLSEKAAGSQTTAR